VLDELHKMKDWRAWLKGIFDGRAENQAILVTGSARLDAFRQTDPYQLARFTPGWGGQRRFVPMLLNNLRSAVV
jgi:hypothetical protein